MAARQAAGLKISWLQPAAVARQAAIESGNTTFRPRMTKSADAIVFQVKTGGGGGTLGTSGPSRKPNTCS